MAQPRAPPLFFSCQAVRRFILELENSEAGRCRAGTYNSAERAQCRAGTVPSGHSAELALVTKCAERARAEQAQCRAGTCRKVGTVPSWHRGGGAVPSGHVPSWHLTKRAEQAQCRAGTCRGTVAPRRSFEAGVEATVVEWLAQRLSTGSPNGLALARPTSFDGSPQPRLMARPNLV